MNAEESDKVYVDDINKMLEPLKAKLILNEKASRGGYSMKLIFPKEKGSPYMAKKDLLFTIPKSKQDEKGVYFDQMRSKDVYSQIVEELGAPTKSRKDARGEVYQSIAKDLGIDSEIVKQKMEGYIPKASRIEKLLTGARRSVLAIAILGLAAIGGAQLTGYVVSDTIQNNSGTIAIILAVVVVLLGSKGLIKRFK
jgi:hypothetical protein